MALEGAYAFDDVGEDVVFDFSGNGRDIQLSGTNGVQEVGGQTGGALGKTASGTIALPATLLVASESEDRTLMFDARGGRSVWWVRWESASLDTGVWGMLSLDAANIIVRARNQANGNPTPSGPTVGALDNTWHNFAMTYVRGSGTLTYYYDGAHVGITEFPDGTLLYVGASELNIAEWGDLGPAMDNLRIYSHALLPSEVAATAGTPVTFPSNVVEGVATANLGSLTGIATGTRVIIGVTSAALVGPAATATGTRTTSGTSAAILGGLTATASGTRAITAQAVAALAGPLAVALGDGTSPATATAQLGGLTATTSGTRATTGSALASLGALLASMTKAAEVTAARIRVAGREPYRSVSGREPRNTI